MLATMRIWYLMVLWYYIYGTNWYTCTYHMVPWYTYNMIHVNSVRTMVTMLYLYTCAYCINSGMQYAYTCTNGGEVPLVPLVLHQMVHVYVPWYPSTRVPVPWYVLEYHSTNGTRVYHGTVVVIWYSSTI